MDDLISRQAAIDAVRDRMGKGETHIGDTFIECFEMILNALPSAHPTQTNTEPTQSNSKPTQDCVERQVVLDWLNDEWDGMVVSVFDGIRTLPFAQPEPQWIPCSERLPEYGKEVLTVNKDGEYEINHVIDEEDSEWFFNGALAWMPLPEPWKGAEHETD